MPVHCWPHRHEPCWFHHHFHFPRNCRQVGPVLFLFFFVWTIFADAEKNLTIVLDFSIFSIGSGWLFLVVSKAFFSPTLTYYYVFSLSCLRSCRSFLMFQQGYSRPVWVSYGIHHARVVSGGTWNWRFWPQVQYCVSWCWSVNLLPIYWDKQASNLSSPRDRGASVQLCWEWRAQVRRIISILISFLYFSFLLFHDD